MRHHASRTMLALSLCFGLLVVGAMSGCHPVYYSDNPPADDPGRGNSIADSLYAETKPTIGEPVDPTNPDYQPMARFLHVRLLEAQERHPDWGVVPLDTTDRPAELRWGGRDGSVLVFLVSPWYGGLVPTSGVEPGTRLEKVLIIRP